MRISLAIKNHTGRTPAFASRAIAGQRLLMHTDHRAGLLLASVIRPETEHTQSPYGDEHPQSEHARGHAFEGAGVDMRRFARRHQHQENQLRQ